MGEANNVGMVPHPDHQPDAKNVIGYWRLVEPGNDAKDEKGLHPGTYVTTRQELPADPAAKSQPAPGTFSFPGVGLIPSDTAARCRKFLGGYVMVPDSPADGKGLYQPEFTIEAWIRPQWAPGFVHMLFFAGGIFTRFGDMAPGAHGFSVFADENDNWRVALVPGGAVSFNVPTKVDFTVVETTHLAVTVADGPVGKTVRLYVNGQERSRGDHGPPPVPVGGTPLPPYSSPHGAPLYIGVSNVPLPDPNQEKARQPILSLIQEAVLYNKVLTPQELKNHYFVSRA